MAHSLSAKKRARQNIKLRLHNQVIKSRIKTQIKKVRLMLTTADKTVKKENLLNEISKSYQLIDKAVSKGVIHKNKAARLKSRLTITSNKVLHKTP